jgi:uncharacterized membrane protein
MTDKIDVAVTPSSFTITAGNTAQATATLRNMGQTVDQFTISLEGLSPDWYTLPVSSVALFPNDQDSLKINLHPPKAGVKSGAYPFRLKVTSQENPAEIATADLTIKLQTQPELGLDVTPASIIGRKGNYQILITNPGDTEVALNLKVSGGEGKLRFNVHPESLKVPGGGRAEANLEASFNWWALLGGEKKFDFQVQAKLPGVEEAKTDSGQLVRQPWYRLLPPIRLPWLTRPPVISTFKATTEDRREFKIAWAVKRATEVKLGDEIVERQGERVMRLTEPVTYVLTASNKYGTSSQTLQVQPRPVPKAITAERIRVSLTPADLQVNAGLVPAVAILQMQNLGQIVDKFLVEVEGLDETWYSRSASSIALMPQATNQVQITFQPPKQKGVREGIYPFGITVRSQTVQGEATTVLGRLQILPAIDFKVTVRPYRISARRKATLRVNLTNTGVSDIKFSIEATDLEEGLNFKFKNDNPTVAAWNSIDVPVVARPKRGALVGERKRYDITITARAGDGKNQTATGEFTHTPFMTSWRPLMRVVRALLVLAVIAVVIYFVLKWGGGWETLSRSPQAWVERLVNTIEGWFFKK